MQIAAYTFVGKSRYECKNFNSLRRLLEYLQPYLDVPTLVKTVILKLFHTHTFYSLRDIGTRYACSTGQNHNIAMQLCRLINPTLPQLKVQKKGMGSLKLLHQRKCFFGSMFSLLAPLAIQQADVVSTVTPLYCFKDGKHVSSLNYSLNS